MTDCKESAERWNEILPQLPGEMFMYYKDRLIEHLEDQLKVACESRKQAEAALRKIFDHDFSCGCDDHACEDCCANQDPADYLCPSCIAGRYFTKPVQEPAERIEENQP